MKNLELELRGADGPNISGLYSGEFIEVEDQTRMLSIAGGYSFQDQVQKSLEAGAARYVGKPYHLADLLKTVRAVLDS